MHSEDKDLFNNPDYSIALERFYKNYKFETNSLERESIISLTDECFAASNENLKLVFKHILSKNKKLLRVAVVGSSGDQALNAIFKGAKDVTLMDKNPMSEMATELKIAGIKNLSFIKFMEYWNKENILNSHVYSKISHSLNDNAKLFWDTIMLEMSGQSDHSLVASIFQRDSFWQHDYDVRGSEFYRRKHSYNKLQKILNTNDYSISYKVADFQDFPKVLEGKFDLIMLSNIYDYVSVTDFFETFDKLKIDNLSSNGVIQLLYDFERDVYFPFLSSFSEVASEYINKDDLHSKVVPSTTNAIGCREYEKNWLYVANEEKDNESTFEKYV